MEVVQEKPLWFDQILQGDIRVLARRFDLDLPCHLQTSDGMTTLYALVSTAAELESSQTDSYNMIQQYLAMIDDLLKEPKACESAYIQVHGQSPITTAVLSKNVDLLRVLAMNGVRMDQPDGLYPSPLSLAVSCSDAAMVRYLLLKYTGPLEFSEYGQGTFGETPFHFAAYRSDIVLLHALMVRGAPILPVDPRYISYDVYVLLRIWENFPKFLLWREIRMEGALSDTFNTHILPLLEDVVFLEKT